jgi:Methylenetetrahydrofolate reductase
MGFLRLVEVFPPLFSAGSRGPVDIKQELQRFVDGIRPVRSTADTFLVANLKNPDLLKFSTLEASRVLRDRLKVDAAPVIVVRDMNRPQFLSSVLAGISLGLRSMMIAWGDEYPSSVGATNIRDFSSLADAIAQAAALRKRAGAYVRIFAPVDIESLAYPKGVALARERLRSGADLLLAQPPTTDADRTFDRHAALVEASGLREEVLLNVFPFRNAKDVNSCEKYFGWKLPRSLHKVAMAGGGQLTEIAKDVARRLRREGYPGVYLSTRGEPLVASTLLS